MSRISRNNLRRRGLSSPFAMVAIFYGVVSLSWGAVITQSAQNVVGALEENVDQENIAIFASAEDESVVRQVLDSASSEISFARYQTSVLRIQSVEDKDVVNTPVLVSSKEPVGFILDGEPWGSTPDGVYVQKYKGIPVGSHLEVTLSDGSVHTVRVAGTFEVAETDQFPGEKTGVLLPESLSRGIAAPDTVQAFIHVPEDQVGKTASLLGKALPQATIISLPEYLEHFIRQYQNLFVFAAAMSGLAILAGILLVANSVSLAMVERRYEIGVLKSLGYSRGQVQAILVVEYVLVAAIMCGSGLLLTWGILGIISMVGGVLGSLLTLKPLTAGMIAAFTIGLTCFTVLLITWRPASVSPVIILNDRE